MREDGDNSDQRWIWNTELILSQTRSCRTGVWRSLASGSPVPLLRWAVEALAACCHSSLQHCILHTVPADISNVNLQRHSDCYASDGASSLAEFMVYSFHESRGGKNEIEQNTR